MRVLFGQLTWPSVVAKFLLWRRLLLSGDWSGSRRESQRVIGAIIHLWPKRRCIYLAALTGHKYRYWWYDHNHVLIASVHTWLLPSARSFVAAANLSYERDKVRGINHVTPFVKFNPNFFSHLTVLFFFYFSSDYISLRTRRIIFCTLFPHIDAIIYVNIHKVIIFKIENTVSSLHL